MPSVPSLVSTLHLIALATFVGVTSVLMLVAVISRLRIRRPLLVWRRSGPLTSLPLGPLLFLLIVAAGFVHVAWTGRSVPLVVLLGYPAGGLFWFVATFLVRTVLVTEYGIVHDLTRVHRTVVWSQVADYFTTTRSGEPYVVFFYRGSNGEHRRLSLAIPKPHAEALYEILHRKLDTRFAASAREAYEEESIDRLDDRIDL